MHRVLSFDERTDAVTQELLQTSFKIGAMGRLVAKDPQGSFSIPWIFLNQNTRKKFCSYWNGIFCLKYQMIPTYCRFNCWKTVIKPRTLRELFEVYDSLNLIDLPSKCGMDVRVYTVGPWAGFVYADSLEQGRRYCAEVRVSVPPEIPVFLKRGCTEMEKILPSDQWDNITHEEMEKEKYLNDLFTFEEQDFRQGEWLKARIKERWIRHAIEIVDPTDEDAIKEIKEVAIQHTGDPNIWGRLVVNSIQYQEVEEDGEHNS